MHAMLEHNALELLMQRLTSLRDDNNDEAAAVFATLSIFENMIEVKPDVAELLVQNTKVTTSPWPSYWSTYCIGPRSALCTLFCVRLAS